MRNPADIECWLTDMDGVLVHEDTALPGAAEFIQRLVDRGLISRRRGAGTVVTSPHVRRPMELSSLFSDLTRNGHEVSTTIIEYSMHPADEEEAEHLGVEPGAGVTRIRRLRRADGDRVMSYTEQYEALAPGQLLAETAAPHRYADAWRVSQAHSFARNDAASANAELRAVAV